MANTMQWRVGQTVQVESRTWAGINKPGGCAKIIKVHCTPDGNYVEGLDVKYLVGGGCEKAIDPAIVSAFETLERGGRKRRSREFLMEREEDARNADQIESIVAVRNCNSNRKTGKTSRKTETSASVSRKPDGGPVIAKETPPSNQSTTSFSTPEKKNKPIPKKVTPIPSLVVTKAIADSVSPMAEDPLLSKDSRKPAARRNLVFGNAAKTEEANVPALPQAEQQEQSPSQRRLRTGDDKAEMKPQIAGTNSRTAQAKGFNNQHSAAAVGTMRSNGAGHSLGVARKAACKQAPSFARTKSAYAVAGSNPTLRNPSETPPAAASRQPLLDVYRYEVQKAYEFMDEMVGPRHEDAEGLKENSSFMDTCSRYDEFLTTFQTLRIQMEDEGAVSEDQFRDLFKEASKQSFSSEEVEKHLESLCNEGKIMRSDGMIFLID